MSDRDRRRMLRQATLVTILAQRLVGDRGEVEPHHQGMILVGAHCRFQMCLDRLRLIRVLTDDSGGRSLPFPNVP